MREDTVWPRLVGVARGVVVAGVGEEDAVVVRVRSRRRDASRCGVCGRRARGYDRGEGARRWRALDLGTTKAFIEAEAPRVECARHGVVVVRAGWARHGSRFTRAFDQQVAWLATHCSKTAVCELMRISWYTVGRIIERVVAEERIRQGDPLEGLSRIGIDELSFRKGQRYITVVVDRDSGRLVWAREGRDKKTVVGFFDELGAERTARIRSSPAIWATASLAPSWSAARRPRSASTPTTWSRSPPRRSTRSAARYGSRPAARATTPVPVGSRAPAGRCGSGPNG